MGAVLESEVSPLSRRRALAVSVIDGAMHAVMLGVTENFLGALAVELGHSATNQALLTTLPILLGALAQLLAPFLSRSFGSRKRFVVMGAALQAFSHLGFIAIAHSENRALLPFLLTKTTYLCGGAMIAPAWSAWMAALTHGAARERYFARRSGVVYVVLLAAFVGGGQLLQTSGDHRLLLDHYASLFWVGLGARTVSSFLLGAQLDPVPTKSVHMPAWAGIQRALSTGNFRIALYLTMLMFGANIAVPFFVPYWFRELHLDYRSFALLGGTAILVKALVFPSFHHLSARFGMTKLLYAAGIVVAVIPAAWAFARTMPAYLAIQVASGAAWGMIEYASFQLLLEDSDESCRVEFLSLAGAISGVGQVAGSMLGSFFIDRLGLAYTDVFWISSVVRCTPLVAMLAVARVRARRVASRSASGA